MEDPEDLADRDAQQPSVTLMTGMQCLCFWSVVLLVCSSSGVVVFTFVTCLVAGPMLSTAEYWAGPAEVCVRERAWLMMVFDWQVWGVTAYAMYCGTSQELSPFKFMPIVVWSVWSLTVTRTAWYSVYYRASFAECETWITTPDDTVSMDVFPTWFFLINLIYMEFVVFLACLGSLVILGWFATTRVKEWTATPPHTHA